MTGVTDSVPLGGRPSDPECCAGQLGSTRQLGRLLAASLLTVGMWSVGDYEPCWRVARAAHQLGLHGILAPAATGFGETLAVFEEHLMPEELPRLVDEEIWEALPADPSQLRAVRDEDAS